MDQPLPFSTGNLTLEEIELIFKKLPLEISFVGADDTVRFFSDKPAEERLFLRSKPALGRDLRLCHPKKYLASMEQIVNDLKTGAQSHARFWRQNHQDKFICIDYFAVRNEQNEYMGIVEVVQNISDLRKLEGDRHEVLYL